MSNWIPKAIAILGITTALTGMSTLVYAQRSQTPQTISQATPSQPPPANNPPVNNRPDLTLLAKSMIKFLQNDSYETESQMQLNAVSQGTSVTLSVQVKTIAQTPNKFRSDIAFLPLSGLTTNSYTIVTDGQQLWTYKANVKKYAVSTYQNFQKSNDSFFIGIPSFMFLQMAPLFRQLITENDVSSTDLMEFLEEMFQSNKVSVKGNSLNIQGREYYSYEIEAPKKDYKFTVLIAQETAIIEEIKMSGKWQNTDITLTEKIISRIARTSLANNTFIFSPPPETTKVPSISIEPFD